VRVLFDQGTPVPLRHALINHSVVTAYEQGWATLKNGDPLRSAEAAGFDVLVTIDTNLRYQQNLTLRQIAILVLTTTSWPRIRTAVEDAVSAVNAATAGSYVEVSFPQNK